MNDEPMGAARPDDLHEQRDERADPTVLARLLVAAGLAAGIVLAVFGARAGMHALQRIPVIPESYTEHKDWMAPLIFGLELFIGAGAALGWNYAWPSMRAAHRWAGRAVFAGFICWWLPVPFGLTQFLTILLLYSIGAMYAWVVVRAIATIGLGRAAERLDPPEPKKLAWSARITRFKRLSCAGLWSLIAGSAAVAAGMLATTFKSIAWAFAID